MGYKLDLKDKRLLYELDLNSRQSFRTLGKKIKLSKNSVINRVNNLKKAGIIKEFQTSINMGKLGYTCFRIYATLQNVTPEKEKEIISYLDKKPIVTWLTSIEGEYNIGALIYVKTIREMNDFWEEFLEKYINYLDKWLVLVLTKVTYFSRAYLMDKKHNTYEIVYISEPQEEKIDKIDAKILRLLSQNARIPIIELAQKSGITSKTIIKKIKELENKGIIVGYRTLFNITRLGYKYFKMHLKLHNIIKNSIQDLKNYIKSHPNMIYHDEMLGGDPVEIELQVKNLEELRIIIDEIRSKFSEIIKEYKIREYYNEHKFLFLPTNF